MRWPWAWPPFLDTTPKARAVKKRTDQLDFDEIKNPPFRQGRSPPENTPLAEDLLHPSRGAETRKHKKPRLVQAPDAYFTDAERPARREVAAVFCQARTAVLCRPLHALCQPTGAEARLPEGAPSGGSSAESTGNGDE